MNKSHTHTSPKSPRRALIAIISVGLIVVAAALWLAFGHPQKAPAATGTNEKNATKVSQPKEVKQATQTLQQTQDTLDVDLNTADLDQEINGLQ